MSDAHVTPSGKKAAADSLLAGVSAHTAPAPAAPAFTNHDLRQAPTHPRIRAQRRGFGTERDFFGEIDTYNLNCPKSIGPLTHYSFYSFAGSNGFTGGEQSRMDPPHLPCFHPYTTEV
jgi:hypothetical protein